MTISNWWRRVRHIETIDGEQRRALDALARLDAAKAAARRRHPTGRTPYLTDEERATFDAIVAAETHPRSAP